jgi:geranylgeranyl reductase family protein
MDHVLVLGAGPAGSAAAAVLARQVCPVLLLDKAEFPRDKVCGDGIGGSTIRLLSDLGLHLDGESQALHSCTKVRGVSPAGDVYEGAFPKKDGRRRHGYVIRRERFDHLLWEHARAQGARFERFRATEPIVEDGLVCGVRGSVNGKAAERRARITIVADGANSVIARALRSNKPPARHYAVAIRSYFKGVESPEDCVVFTFNQTQLPGYGWIFPLGGGEANVGVGLRLDVARSNAMSLRQRFEQFIRDPRVADRLSQARQVEKARGGFLPLASQRIRRTYPGALLVGDAGALISPLTGGGIYNALESGRIAANVALESLQGNGGTADELRQFDVQCRRSLGRELKSAAMFQKLLSWPGMLDLVIRRMGRNERFARLVLNRF